MSWKFSNDKPIYTQVMERIEREIVSGRMKPGDQIPSIRDLSTTAGVNPNTMQKALAEIERKGLISTDRTNGKFINSDQSYIEKIKEEHAKINITVCLQALKELGYEDEEIIGLINKIMEEM